MGEQRVYRSEGKHRQGEKRGLAPPQVSADPPIVIITLYYYRKLLVLVQKFKNVNWTFPMF